MEIYDFDLSMRAQTALEYNDLIKISDLVNMSKRDLLELRCFGRKEISLFSMEIFKKIKDKRKYFNNFFT